VEGGCFDNTGAGNGWGMYLRACSWCMEILIDVEKRICREEVR